MRIGARGSGAGYRRGVILGLTVAEFMTIMTFLVLVASVATVEAYRRARLEAERRVLTAQVEHGMILRELAQAGVTLEQARQDLGRARQELLAVMALRNTAAQLETAQRELRTARRELDAAMKLQSETAAAALASDNGRRADAARLVLEQSANETLRSQLATAQQQLSAAMNTAEAARHADRETLRGIAEQFGLSPTASAADVAAAARELRASFEMRGRPIPGAVPGSGIPHCWSTGTNNLPEFILQVRLLDNDTIVVTDPVLRPRPDDPAWQAIAMLPRGVMRTSALVEATAQLRVLGRQSGCAYAIALEDGMSNDKLSYKAALGRLRTAFFVQERR